MIDGIAEPVQMAVMCGDSFRHQSEVDAGTSRVGRDRRARARTVGGEGVRGNEIIAEFQHDTWRTRAEFIEAAHRRANGTRGGGVGDDQSMSRPGRRPLRRCRQRRRPDQGLAPPRGTVSSPNPASSGNR